jgi:hypothetical protein
MESVVDRNAAAVLSGYFSVGAGILYSENTGQLTPNRYVAMHAMQEGDSAPAHDTGSGANGYADNSSPNQRKQGKPQMRDTIATIVGMLLPLLTQFGHHH